MNIRKFATIAVLVVSSFAATNVAPTKAELDSMYDKAFREFSAANYEQALKELDAIDARQPDLAESQNLRGVILMRQAQYDQAEAALQKALATDPKFWNARFNLAEIPFLRKEWAEARKRFEGLLQGGTAELQGEAALAFKPQGPGGTSVGARMNHVNYFKGAVRQARFTTRALPPGQFLKLPGPK